MYPSLKHDDCMNNKRLSIYVHLWMHSCMHACMHAYIHTYIHTYIHERAHMLAFLQYAYSTSFNFTRLLLSKIYLFNNGYFKRTLMILDFMAFVLTEKMYELQKKSHA